MEEWRTVSEDSNYIVSNTGRVRRVGSNKDHSLKSKGENGYLSVDLYSNGKRKIRRVHRLVAKEFIPNPNNKPQVNHKDGNRQNNNVDNLEWVTGKENCQHAWKNGLVRPSYGMLGKKNPNGGRHGKPFIIIETGERFRTAKECAEKINGNYRHINDCLRGRQVTHRGYHFEYI